MATTKIHTAPAGLLAVALLALGTVTTVRGQTTLEAKLLARPVTRGDIAAYKLPATTQLSGGLFNVGVGQPVYLEAQVAIAVPAADITGVTWELAYKPSKSAAVLADSPLGNDVPIFEPSDRLVFQVAARKLLRPDAVGEYVVWATIKTAGGETAKVGQTFIATTYVGINTCSICHSGGLVENMATSWAQTNHAKLFKEGVNGAASDHYGANCILCHTVGYDANPAAVNRGFDDIATQLKWVFPTVQKEGTWDAVPDALKNLANIQCENCHGPGSAHASGAFDIGVTVSLGSGVCAPCHDAPAGHIKNREWNNSRHAIATRHPSGPGEESCVGCHTGPGFVGRAKELKTVNTDYTPITCQTCHEPHGQSLHGSSKHLVRTLVVKLADGTQVAEGGTGRLCMNCHMSRRNAATYAATQAASSRFGPHYGTQADMLAGVNGFTYGQAIPSSKHREEVEDSCATCHMQAVARTDANYSFVGGHTFKPSWEGDGTKPAHELVGACQGCHGASITSFDFKLADYDGDGAIDGVQTEVQHLLDKVSALLPPVGQAKSSFTIDATWTRPQLQAVYNWQFVKNDGSLGIHNTAYAVGLLKASLADLTKK